MFTLALLIAIFSYIIFALGLLGGLKSGILLLISLLFIFFILILLLKIPKARISSFLWELKKDRLLFLIFLVLVIQSLINLLGAFGPELSFDALWYHLTLPKIYLTWGRVFYLPSGLLYYSASPQLVEMLFIPALKFLGSWGPKFIHFLFGIGSIVVQYKIYRKFLSIKYSLLACLVFYSQLTIGWLSTAAYNDLGLLFFHNLGLLAFLEWWGKSEDKWLIESGVLFGLSGAVKLIGLYVPMALILIFFIKRRNFSKIILFGLAALMPLLPWFCYSYLATGNPLYPYFSSWFFKSQSMGLSLGQWLLTRTPWSFIKAVWQTVFTRGDILSPLIIICLPIILVTYILKRKIFQEKNMQLFSLYIIFYGLFWFFTPINYNRFLLPALPILFLMLFIAVEKFWTKTILPHVLIISIFFISLVNLGSRIMANKKYVPLLLAKEKEAQFIKRELNFGAGNFYDTGGILKSIAKDKKVLVTGIHNLYYVDVPFKELSWAQKGDTFSYVLVGKDYLGKLFARLPVVYRYPDSKVILYKARISF